MEYLNLFKKSLLNISFKGRSTRKEYLTFKVFQFIINIIFFIIFFIPLLLLGYQYGVQTGIISLPESVPNLYLSVKFLGIYSFFMASVVIPINIWLAIANLCVAVRRLHDFNYSGWVYLIYIIIVLALTFVKDSQGIANSIGVMASFAEIIILSCVKGSDGLNSFDSFEEEKSEKVNPEVL